MSTLSAMNTLYATHAKETPPAGLFDALRREWSYIKAARALNRLDDAALQDVGVPRGSIGDAVRHGR